MNRPLFVVPTMLPRQSIAMLTVAALIATAWSASWHVHRHPHTHDLAITPTATAGCGASDDGGRLHHHSGGTCDHVHSHAKHPSTPVNPWAPDDSHSHDGCQLCRFLGHGTGLVLGTGPQLDMELATQPLRWKTISWVCISQTVSRIRGPPRII